MFRSIINDIKTAFNNGSMLTKLIIINVGVYVVTAVMGALLPELYTFHILPYLALPGDPATLLYRPWTLVTHMFLHQGFWHMAMNMLILYWFGNIAGDLLGDRRILPVYILGGLTGALFYLASYQWMPMVGGFALGASAATLAIVFTAVITAPDYYMHLILLGPVKIKYIGITILFFDIIGTSGTSNTGGHIAHLGGTLFGIMFVYLLRKGTDITSIFTINKFKRTKRTKLKISHKAVILQEKKHKPERQNIVLRVDEILDKINQKGYDSLTDEEKEILYRASKK